MYNTKSSSSMCQQTVLNKPRSETTECDVWSGSFLFATDLKFLTGSKINLYKVKDKYGKLEKLTLCMLGNFACLFVICGFSLKLTFFQKNLSGIPSNSLDLDQALSFVLIWVQTVCKLFAKVISRPQKSPLVGKELTCSNSRTNMTSLMN